MATILLNVKVNENDIKKAEQQISRIFNGTNSNGGNGNGLQSSTANVNNLQKSVANLLNTLKGSEAKYAPKVFEDLKNRVKQTLEEVKSLNKEIGDDKPTEEQRKALATLKKTYQQLGAEFSTLRVESEKLQKENKLAIPNIDDLRKKYANLLTTIQGAEKYYKKGTFSNIANDAKKYLNELRNLDPASSGYAENVNRLDKALGQLSAQFAETRQQSENMHGSLLEIVKGFMKFQLAAMVVMKPLQLLRNAWADINETLVETENRVVELRRVAGQVANSDELYSLAQRYGQTFENVSEITLNFARNGMGWAEALQATEAALLAINVAELDATQASEGMIAVMNQFGVEASELEEIVDKLNITADNAAVTTEKLLLALQRTGSSAKNAKLDLQETVGIITALSEATGRSGENLGTAVNSLIQFSTKSSSLDTFEKLGGDVQKTVEAYRQGGATVLDIWTQLSKVIKQNQGLSESVLGKDFSTSDFESLNEELKESLGAAFAETTEIYDTASTFRKNYFIALLQNLDQVQETLDTMNSAQGYSQQENLQYLDTYTAKVNTLEAKWQEIANDEQGLLGIKKVIVDIASFMLTVLDYAGGIKNVLLIIGSIVVANFGAKILGGIAVGFKAIGSAILGATKALVNFKTVASGIQAVLGWVGIATAVISGIVNAVNESKEADYSGIASSASDVSKIEKSLESVTKEYDDLANKISNYRSALEDNTSTEKEREEALKGLNEIQNSLKDNTNEYASSLDLVNGNLDEQIKKVQQLSFLERQRQLKNFQEQNIDAISDAKEYLNQKLKDIGFSDSYGLYEGDSEFSTWLQEQGYKEDATASWSDFWEDFGEGFVGIFGGKISTDIKTPEMTRGQQIDYLEEMFVKAHEIENKEKRERIQGIIRKAIKSIQQDETFSASSNLIYGNAQGSTLYEKLSNEQREALLKTTSQEEWDNLLKEWGYPSATSAGGNGVGTPETSADIDSIVDNLKAIRDNTEKTKELEEKQLALEEAKNARTVRVFNSQTGQFEMRSNERAISSAQEALKNTALDNVLEVLESGELPEGYQIPEWLQNLVAPTDEEKFDRFLTSMGILSGVFNKTATPQSRGAVYNNGGNTTNNNQSYSLNGIPIPAQDAGRYFTPEALELLNQMG